MLCKCVLSPRNSGYKQGGVPLSILTCKTCGKSFKRTSAASKFCSMECRPSFGSTRVRYSIASGTTPFHVWLSSVRKKVLGTSLTKIVSVFGKCDVCNCAYLTFSEATNGSRVRDTTCSRPDCQAEKRERINASLSKQHAVINTRIEEEIRWGVCSLPKDTCDRCGCEYVVRRKGKRWCSRACSLAESCRNRHSLRRMRRLGSDIEGSDRVTLLTLHKKQKGLCAICGERTPLPGADVPHADKASLDHIYPLSKGGTHTWDNVQMAHLGCNARKNANVDESTEPSATEDCDGEHHNSGRHEWVDSATATR